jgi:hypothetical protein
MGWRIEIDDGDYRRLRDHLSGEVEQVAFLFTEPHARGQRLRVRGMRLVGADGFKVQSAYHVELADHIRPEVIKQAWDEKACVIEAHSHVDGPAQFSWSDLVGFDEWVPHMDGGSRVARMPPWSLAPRTSMRWSGMATGR